MEEYKSYSHYEKSNSIGCRSIEFSLGNKSQIIFLKAIDRNFINGAGSFCVKSRLAKTIVRIIINSVDRLIRYFQKRFEESVVRRVGHYQKRLITCYIMSPQKNILFL